MIINPTFDQGHAGATALGLIVLKTDETLEVETRTIFGAADIACYHARIPSHADVTAETLKQMEADLPHTAALLPSGVPFGAIGYGCTSGATVIGPTNISSAIKKSHPGAAVTNPITAVMAALGKLGVRRLGLLTPYLPDVTRQMQDYLGENGFEINRVQSFGQVEDRKIARISERSTLAAIAEIGKDPKCDGVFASCTNLRSFGILNEAEHLIGKPVVTSNQALGWHMLKLAGVRTNGFGPGRLFVD